MKKSYFSITLFRNDTEVVIRVIFHFPYQQFVF